MISITRPTKAFDTVWHEVIITIKLVSYNFPPNLIRLISSFLKTRTGSVHINIFTSTPFYLLAGLPQGSVLSPILFNIYTCDIPKMKNVKQYSFADDFAISSSAKYPRAIIKSLNKGLNEYARYCKTWKLKVNESKIEAIFFARGTSRRKLPDRKLNISDNEVEWKNEIKYLGVTLDKRLTFKKHIENRILSATKTSLCLYSFTSRKSKINLKNKLLLYKQILRPIFLYAYPTHLKKIQVFQNKFLKRILNLPLWHSTSDIHHRTNMIKIIQYADLLLEKYKTNCTSSPW